MSNAQVDQLERYNRNILVKEVGVEGQKKLLNSSILVAGCGGLGSNVLSSLASVGIGTLGLIDNDSVELTNLNRQFIHPFHNIGIAKVESAKNWIKSFNPDININAYQTRLDESNCNKIILDYDIVIDCFDSFHSKFMLNKVCVDNNKILVHGGVTEFYGQVMLIKPTKTPCLACLFPDYDYKNSKETTKGVLSPAVNIIGAMQSMEAVKIILGIGELLDNCFLSYDSLNHSLKKTRVNKMERCPVCADSIM